MPYKNKALKVLSGNYAIYKKYKEISNENKVQVIFSLSFLSFLWVDKTDHLLNWNQKIWPQLS